MDVNSPPISAPVAVPEPLEKKLLPPSSKGPLLLKPAIFALGFVFVFTSSVIGFYFFQKNRITVQQQAQWEGKLVCMPIDNNGNLTNIKNRFKRIKVINKTTENIHIWVQWNSCPYTGEVKECQGYEDRKPYLIGSGDANAQIFSLDQNGFRLDCEELGQLDVSQDWETYPGETQCFNTVDNKIWEGGIAFTMAANATSCTAPTNTPVPLATPTGTRVPTPTGTRAPTPTVTRVPTATPTPGGCHDSCTTAIGCRGDLVCWNWAGRNQCVNTGCADNPNCVCPTVTPTNTPRPTVTPTRVPGCMSDCVSDTDCSTAFPVCDIISKACRKNCPAGQVFIWDDCICRTPVIPTPTVLSCLNLTATKAGSSPPSLDNLKPGDTILFEIVPTSGSGTVQSTAIRVMKDGVKAGDFFGNKTGAKWIIYYKIPSSGGGSYEISAFIKVNGVWK